MHYTTLISVVKTSTKGCDHFVFIFTQTSVFSDFLKVIPGQKWNIKVRKNQCFMNGKLLFPKCQPIDTEATQCTTLHI